MQNPFLLVFLQYCKPHNIQNGKPEFKANLTHSESTKPVCCGLTDISIGFHAIVAIHVFAVILGSEL